MNEIWISLISVFGTLAVGYIGFKYKRSKSKAEETDLITQATDRVIKMYIQRDTDLEQRLEKTEARLHLSENAERVCQERLSVLELQQKVMQAQITDLLKEKIKKEDMQ